MESIETQIENLYRAMAVLEEQRAVLGEAVIEPALVGLRQQIALLQAQRPLEPQPAAAALPAKERGEIEERRIITILFTDVVGSTSLAEQMDPEEWREVVDRLHSAVGEIVQANRGLVAQYLGDGLLALFGAQEVSERDPEHAVRCALAVQEAAGTLSEAFPGLRSPLQIRVGVHTGLVVLGEIGSQARREFTATGDAMNLAARLQSSAPPGGILISQDTYRCVRGVFDIAPQPILAMKGKREPVQTFLVLRARERAFRTAARGPGWISTRTIGRDRELAQLQAAYLEAYKGQSLVWSQIVGEPGMGKSRLMDEMIDFLELRPERLRLFRGRAFEGETRQPFALLRRLWFDRFQIAEDALLPEAEGRWVDEFLKLGGGDSAGQLEAAQVVGRLVGLPFAGSRHLSALESDPAQLKGRAFVASQQLLRAVRRTQPIVFLLEDLHWSDSSSWEYLTQVVLSEPGPEEQGLFILATARPEWTPPEALTRHTGYRQTDLLSLSSEATLELAQALLQAVEEVPEQVIRTIAERAEGVPYFVEEIVYWLLDHGVIDSSLDPWRFLPERLEQFHFPASLQHLLLARLNALEKSQRLALQRGAVYGRHFWTGGLEALGVEESEPLLRQLQPRGLIDSQPESSFEGESEWSFHHNLLREVTYESILKRERARLHRAAAAWLEGQAIRAGRLDEFAALLGIHVEQGGDTRTAARWFARAGERARSQGALREALGFFERALDLFPPDDREERWQALFRRCSLMSDLGQAEGRREALQALLELSTEIGEPYRLAEANSLAGFFLSNSGEDRQALSVYEAGLTAARQAGDRSIEARLLALKVVSLSRLGEFQAAAPAVDEALASASELTDADAMARSYTNISLFYGETGDLAQAAKMVEQAAELHFSLAFKPGEAINLSNLGYTYVQLGMARRSLSALRRAIELAENVGARRVGMYAGLNLALAHFRMGDLPAARKILDQILPDFEAVTDNFARASTHSYLALTLEAGGESEPAFQHYSKAREIMRFIEATGYANDALAGLARCALALGRIDEASEYAGQLWEALQRLGPKGMEFPVWAYLTCAEVFQARGETDSSRAAVQAGYQELSTRAGKISDPEWRRSFLENIPEHREIARRAAL